MTDTTGGAPLRAPRPPPSSGVHNPVSAMASPTQDTLILPRWMACVDGTRQVLEGHAVLVREGRIADLGPAAVLRQRHPQAICRALPDHLLFPGLVNAHAHAAMALLRGAGPDLPLMPWLEQCIWPMEQAILGPDYVYDGTVLALEEMVLGGVTCLNDMYFFPGSGIRAACDLGVRISAGIPVFDFPSAWGSGPDDYLAKGLALYEQLAGTPGVHFTLSPHAPYTNSDDALSKVAALARRLNLPVVTHLHETRQEVEESVQRTGRRPLARLEALGLLEGRFLGVHSVCMNDDDLRTLARAGAAVAHCPHSNLKLASGVAPITRMQEAGIPIGIGTDGSASNDRLDVLAEVRTASLLAKGTTGNAATFDVWTALECATLGGARALGLDGETGSIEIGKSADLVAADLSSPRPGMILDPVATLIHALGRESVTDVWIRGMTVVRERQISPEVSRATISAVRARMPLWHNQLGEFIPDRAV